MLVEVCIEDGSAYDYHTAGHSTCTHFHDELGERLRRFSDLLCHEGDPNLPATLYYWRTQCCTKHSWVFFSNIVSYTVEKAVEFLSLADIIIVHCKLYLLMFMLSTLWYGEIE